METQSDSSVEDHEDVHEETLVKTDEDTKISKETEEIPQLIVQRSTWIGSFPKRWDEFATFVPLIANE